MGIQRSVMGEREPVRTPASWGVKRRFGDRLHEVSLPQTNVGDSGFFKHLALFDVTEFAVELRTVNLRIDK